ncbi:lysylphosphatidylglycerol synthase transmembrane domain-containing protein [Methylomonas montana]|uniref:lysylphosphatidylglycerol synthase transmembrane domain-containing protein n=1 Tax=Methylomonas montana TaxID=3058963 RepID=UPI00265A53FD|nr:lysylphosphatidylglycerol synthase transmembrane domain-containing protein [Methylomonas montana]WKJ92020.1 lysylphosphatidylglycerol synthase transmembrane domain-containing protein [Methylomonas montana]
MSLHKTKKNKVKLIAKKAKLRKWLRNLMGVAVSGACLGFIAWRIDLDEVRNAISNFQWIYLVWGLLSLMGGYSMRIIRWATLLKASGTRINISACIAPFLGSIALNNTLPMRVGDVVRAFVFPSAIGVGKTTATGSLVMERLIDLMTLLACLMIGLSISPTTKLPEWLETTAVSLSVFGGVTLMLVFLLSGRLSRWFIRLAKQAPSGEDAGRGKILKMLGILLSSFDAMSRLPVLIWLTSLSVLVWVGEAGLFWALLLGFGLVAAPETAVIVMAIATLSTLAPSSPGYVGPFHLAAYAAISMLGGTPGEAASFAVLSHLGVWLPTTLAGALAILFNPQLFGSVKAKAETIESTN